MQCETMTGVPKYVDHQLRREEIAAALMRVAADRGLQAVSLRHVAAEAGVTAGMVQHYFPTKDAMMDFAMRTAAARYETRMTQALSRLDESASAREVVGVVLRTLLPLTESQRADGRVALAFQAYAATQPSAAQGLTEDNHELHAFLSCQVECARPAQGVPAARDPAHTATALLALAEGLGVMMLSTTLSAGSALAALEGQLDAILGPDAARSAEPLHHTEVL